MRHGYFVGGQKVEVKSKKEPTDQQHDNDMDDAGGVKQRRKTTDSPRPKSVSITLKCGLGIEPVDVFKSD